MSLVEEPANVARAGYAELAAEIKALGLLRRRPGYYAMTSTTHLLSLALLVTAMILVRESWWLMIAAVLMAIVFAQLGFLGPRRRPPPGRPPGPHQPTAGLRLRATC